MRIAPLQLVPSSRATVSHRAQVSSSIFTERAQNRFDIIKFLLYKNADKLNRIYTFESPILHEIGTFVKIFFIAKIGA
jgi:hypothetical protein